MVSNFMFRRIRKLIKDGKNNSQISEETGVDRKTVAKYRESNSPPKYSERMLRTKPDPTLDYMDRIRWYKIQDQEITAADIFLLIRNEGYTGSERTVFRRVASLKDNEEKERFFEQKYEPGEQCQFDFKESVELPFIIGNIICHIHVSTLPYSDFFHLKAFPSKTYEAFMDGCHSFFECIEGLTENIRIDNLSPCVKKILKGRERIYTKAFDKAIDYYGYKVLPCEPGKGNQKGDVERDIRTHIHRVKNLIKLSGRKFSDFNDLNSWLKEYCIKYQSAETLQKLAIEQEKLNPLPPADDTVLCHTETLRVSSYGTLWINRLQATYSVPDRAIGSWVEIRISAFSVKIFRGKELLAEHNRLSEGEKSILPEHILPSLLRKPQAMVRWTHRQILFPNPNFKRYYDFLKGRDAYSAEREFLKAVNLIQYTTLDEIGIAMELVMDTAEIEDPFQEVKKLVTAFGHTPDMSDHLLQPPINLKLTHYDLFIPTTIKEDQAS